jgi:hypothetical protein
LKEDYKKIFDSLGKGSDQEEVVRPSSMLQVMLQQSCKAMTC